LRSACRRSLKSFHVWRNDQEWKSSKVTCSLLRR
jgi:hypothetical protein